MQGPNSQSITLGDILITAELSHRVSRAPNLQAENQAMRALIHQMAQDSEILMQTLVDKALELCEAGTAGLSLLETTPDGEEIFRWNALAGTLAHYVGGSTPRNFSPCGVCLDQGSPVLFSHPERYFTYFQDADTPIVEGLVLPLVADRHIFGTIWIVSHDEQRQFDSEDVRIMTSLADFTATALLLQQRQTKKLLAANAALEAEIAERKQTEAQLSEAQRRLELSLEGANLGTWTYRVDTDEFWADDRALHLHGHAPGEVHTFADAGVNIHSVDREQTQVVLAQALQTHSKVQVEYRVIWPDGSVHWIASYAEFMPLDEDEGMFYGIVLDITERKQSEAAIAADLQDTQRLHNLATRLTTEGNIETLYQEIMVAAIALTRADAGSIQILDEATQELVLIATQGPTPEMIEHFHRVNAGSNTSCGRALVTGDRTFVDFDVPRSEDPDGSLRMHVEAGYLSAQSTPLITRSGKVIGMVSTHWREHHRPSERELRFLDLLARQAADLIEQRQAQVVLHESEARLQSIANLVPDLLWDSEPDGSTNWYNQRWIEYTGQTFEQAIGWDWIDAIHPDDREESARRYREAVEQGVMLQQEHRIRRHDGEYRWFVVNAFPLKDESGKVIKIYGAATDIHEARISLAALQESEAKYRSLFNSIDEGFCVFELLFDDEGNAVDWIYKEANPAFEQQTGYINPIGQRISEFQPNLERSWFERFAEVARTGEPIRFVQYTEAMGIWYDVYAFRVGAAGNHCVSLLFTDVTDRKRREEQQQYLLKLSDALRLLSDPLEIQRAAMRIVGESLQVDRVLYADITPDGKMWVAQDNYTSGRLPKLIGSFPTAAFGTSVEPLRHGEVIVYPDIEKATDLTEAEQALYKEHNIQSALGVPLFKDGRWISNIGIHHTEPREWTEAEIALVQETAERTWAAVERARAEAALRKSEEGRQIALEAAQMGTFVWFPQENRGEPDARMLSLFGLNEGDVLNLAEALTNMIHPGDRDLYAAAVTQSLDPNGDGTLYAEIRVIHPDESLHWVAVTAQTVFEGQPPQPMRMYGIAADITSRKQSEADQIRLIQEQSARKQEQQRAEALAELDRAKTLFFTNISHEFRTPLTLSLAPLQEVLERLDEWEQGSRGAGEQTDNPIAHQPIVPPILKHNLQLVHRNHLRLLKLVNTLLDFSRIEADRMEAVYEPVDLAMFTTELASVFQSAIDRAGLQLIVDCPPLPDPVYVDREMWEKIVLNLLSNALKFTFEGEIRIRVYSASGEQGSRGAGEQHSIHTSAPPHLRTSAPHAILEICDTGTGIAPEHIPHLFERFYQVRATQARTDEGSGIGLALVHELVRFHGGTIDVSSTVGEGTCFTIALPFGSDHLPSDRLQDQTDRRPIRTLTSTGMSHNAYLQEAERWIARSDFGLPILDFGLPILDFGLDNPDTASPDRDFDQLTNPPKSKIQNPKSKILLVDDNADMREYLTRILSEYVQVKAAENGTTALKVAQDEVPDLILSDVMMPGLDGFELLRALRADPRTKEIPIILLSARAGEEAIVEGLEAGADDYWIKPFSAQELISRVMAHLQMAQLRGAALQQERTMNRHKDEFISVISHELNTPLASILGWTRLLRSSPLNPAILSKALDMIERNATLQSHLVQDLLDLSRITAGKLRLNLQPIALKPVIETAIATVIQTASAKDIHLTWQDNSPDAIVMGDSDRLSQVLINLLANAIKFTPESGHVRIELSVIHDDSSANPSYAEIRVMDTGIGIVADFLPHVFDRFRQAEGINATKGLGLGLAIARHIVELHNGSVRAESPGEGQGTTLIVELPLIQ